MHGTCQPSLGGAGLLLGKRRKSQVWLNCNKLWEQFLCLLVGDGGVNDDISSGNPGKVC